MKNLVVAVKRVMKLKLLKQLRLSQTMMKIKKPGKKKQLRLVIPTLGSINHHSHQEAVTQAVRQLKPGLR